MAFAPVVELDKNGVRRYGNVHTANHWNLRQRVLPPGTTFGGAIFMSDATTLTQHTGDVSAHGVYMSLANIDKSIRAEISSGAWLLIGIIPKSNWNKTLANRKDLSDKRRAELISMLNRRLFHYCMEIITRPFRRTEPVEVLDWEGNMRLVLFELCIYGADLEEQCHISGISRNACPNGGSKGKTLGQLDCPDTRTSQAILERIKKVEEDWNTANGTFPNFEQFLDAGKKYDLNGVQRPFWRLLPNFDISRVLSPDLLHGFHKAFGDHVDKWNRNALGNTEYDTRLKAQIPVPGERTFKEGATKLKQLSVRDNKALGRVHIPIIANSGGGANGQTGNRKLVVASRAFVHCVALAQLPVHTEKTILEYKASIKLFHQVRDVWIENNWKLGAKGNLIPDWGIPKIHVMGHAPDHIEQKGSMDNFNTETMERLHIPMLKEGYRGSNRKGYLRQIVRRLRRQEIMQEYSELLEWIRETKRAESAKIVGANEGPEAGKITEKEDGATEDDDDDDDDEDDDEEEDDEGYESDGTEDDDYGDDFVAEQNSYDESNSVENYGGEHGQEEDMHGRAQGLEMPEFRESEQRLSHTLRDVLDTPQIGGAREGTEAANKPVSAGTSEQTRSPDSTAQKYPKYQQPLGFPTTLKLTHLIPKRPTFKNYTVGDITHLLGFPKFFKHLREHPYFKNIHIPIHPTTSLNVWKTIRIRTPGSSVSPEEHNFRIYSHSGLDKTLLPRWDPVFYLPTNSPIVFRDPGSEVIQDYSVGRVALLFALHVSAEVPEPRVMAYIERFSDIPKAPTGATGLHAEEMPPKTYARLANTQRRPSPRCAGRSRRRIVTGETMRHKAKNKGLYVDPSIASTNNRKPRDKEAEPKKRQKKGKKRGSELHSIKSIDAQDAQIRNPKEAGQISKRRSLVLPAAQVGEAELEDAVKIGQAGQSARALMDEGEGNEASGRLLGEYEGLGHVRVARILHRVLKALRSCTLKQTCPPYGRHFNLLDATL
ncbi:hypothetical protein RhiJN_02707 [Ceratobasidium sp. AG-Ba]|nr:hypothetical protein RhiJN_02707 [Ceratobasidium sp. AG-Ba]